MQILAILVASLMLLAPAALAGSSARLSLGEAEAICGERATKLAYTPRGRDYDYPPNNLVQDFYRACVFGYSRQKASGKLEYCRSVLPEWGSFGC